MPELGSAEGNDLHQLASKRFVAIEAHLSNEPESLASQCVTM